MNKLVKGLLVVIATLSLVACNKDDGYSIGDFYITVGTVVKTTDYYYVVTDGGTKLWPAASNVSPAWLEDGQRSVVNFTILGDGAEGEEWDHYVKINAIDEMLTKPYFQFGAETSQETRDSIGTDPIRIKDAWVVDDYITVGFEYGGWGHIHFVNLVHDTENATNEEGDFILELMHNKNGDPNNNLQYGIASFDISELIPSISNGELTEVTFELFHRSLGTEAESFGKVVFEIKDGEVVTPVHFDLQGGQQLNKAVEVVSHLN